jgi:hypothetical protein
VAFDARVAGEGVRAADQNVEVGLLEHAQRRAVKRLRFWFENLQLRRGSGHIVPSFCGKGYARSAARILRAVRE